MKLQKLVIVFLICVSNYLYANGLNNVEPINAEYRFLNPLTAQTDFIAVEFTFQLPFIKQPKGLLPGTYVHYRLFFDFGDGNIDMDTVNVSTVSSARYKEIRKTIIEENEHGEESQFEKVDSIFELTLVHNYHAKPTKPVRITAAKIKSTDHVPPPAIIINIDENDATSEDIKRLFQSLPSADDYELPYQEETQNKLEFGAPVIETSPEILEINDTLSPISNHLALSFRSAPVRNNFFDGVCEIFTDNSVINSGTLLLHINRTEFFDPSSGQPFDLNSIRAWKSETLTMINLNSPLEDPFYPNLEDSTFSHLIRIDFTNLNENVLRRIMLPFICPPSFDEDLLFEPVIFLGILLDTEKVDQFRESVETLVEVIQPTNPSEVEEFDLNNSTGKLNGTSYEGTKNTIWYEDTYETIKTRRGTIRINRSNPLDYQILFSSQLKEVLDDLDATLLDTILDVNYIRSAHDPNSISIEPQCTYKKSQDVIGLVEFENYGLGAATEITIRIPVGNIFEPGSFDLIDKPSIGRVQFNDTVVENGILYHQFKLVDLYLAGHMEIAIETGQYTEEELYRDWDTIFKDVIENNPFGSYTRGFIKFKARTKLRTAQSAEYRPEVEIIFNRNEPIKADTVLKFDPDCDTRTFIFGSGIKLGYNYPLNFRDLSHEPSFDLKNLSIGTFLDLNFNTFLRNIGLRLEGNWNNFSLSNQDIEVTNSSFELTAQVRYEIDQFRIGVGANSLRNIRWKENEGISQKKFSTTMNGIFLDLGFEVNYFQLGIGTRAYYYPDVTIIDAMDNFSQIQLYITKRF